MGNKYNPGGTYQNFRNMFGKHPVRTLITSHTPHVRRAGPCAGQPSPDGQIKQAVRSPSEKSKERT